MTKLLCISAVFLSALSAVRCDDKVVRDANGLIIATISATANGNTLRNSSGKVVGRIVDTATGKVVRDENGRLIGRTESSAVRPSK